MMVDRSSVSSVRSSNVESLTATSSQKGVSSLATNWSVEKGQSGSGKVTTLHQLRQSESNETSVAHKALQEHKAALLSAKDLLQALERIFNHPH